MKGDIMVFRYNSNNFSINKSMTLARSEDVGSAATFEDFKNYNLVVNSYREFIKKIETDEKYVFEKSYINFLEKDTLYVLRRNMYSTSHSLIIVYKFEYPEFYDFFKALFRNRESIMFDALKESAFNWVCNSKALKVMMAEIELKHKGILLFEKHQKRKKNGKMRTYYAPNELLKGDLRELNTVLTSVYDSRNIDFQVAYKKGKSVLNNAEQHKNNKYVFNIDLKDFYPSCKRELVRQYVGFLFKSAPNYKYTVERFLDCILIDDGLFIGNPISGCLANTIISKPVLFMKNICEKCNMGFSVYADDMSFSSNKFISKNFVIDIFDRAFAQYNLADYFSLNEDKCIGYSGCNRKITGVSINSDNKTTCSKKYYKLLRAMIQHLSAGDTTVNIGKLRGKIAYALMIDDSGKVYRYLKKFESIVKKYNLCSDEKLQELSKKFN